MTGKSALLSTLMVLLAGLLAGSTLISEATAQAGPEQAPSGQTRPMTASSLSESARAFYRNVHGVEIIGVRSVSGSFLRFSYRVLDPKKAGVLNDRRWNPYLIDVETGIRRTIPNMDMIGQLRQTPTPEKGRIYWMIFDNAGGLIKRGSRVNIVIGNFRAENLVVE